MATEPATQSLVGLHDPGAVADTPQPLCLRPASPAGRFADLSLAGEPASAETLFGGDHSRADYDRAEEDEEVGERGATLRFSNHGRKFYPFFGISYTPGS